LIDPNVDCVLKALQGAEEYRRRLAEDLLRDRPAYRLRDEGGQEQIAHGGIWLFDLSKFDGERIKARKRSQQRALEQALAELQDARQAEESES